MTWEKKAKENVGIICLKLPVIGEEKRKKRGIISNKEKTLEGTPKPDWAPLRGGESEAELEEEGEKKRGQPVMVVKIKLM